MPGQFVEIHSDIRSCKRVDDVSCERRIASLAMCQVSDLTRFGDQPLGKQKAQGEFLIMAGRAHRDCDALAVYADFQRLLSRDGIIHYALTTIGLHLGYAHAFAG